MRRVDDLLGLVLDEHGVSFPVGSPELMTHSWVGWSDAMRRRYQLGVVDLCRLDIDESPTDDPDGRPRRLNEGRATLQGLQVGGLVPGDLEPLIGFQRPNVCGV